MTDQPRNTLVRLDDSGRTVADPAHDVRGRTVLDGDGEELGTVDDLLVDRDETPGPGEGPGTGPGEDAGGGQVRMLRVKHGGLLGIGADVFFVPVDAVTGVDEDAVHVDLGRDRVEGAPQYDPELVDQYEYYSSVYGYYGFTPYWAPGYVRPPWPGSPVL
ncbi:PRC-barrel domain-containing protein [Kineococcus sp. LSe6-4]|uniref:PRC-barrel domain-containing protein n=1 Tax=Kineococcus halophytocola TaxID=3234027 RepID=A0ABV4H1H6_9ACTN